MWHNEVHFFWGVATLWPRRKGKPTLKKMDKMQRTQLVHESCLRYECLTSHVLNKRVSVSVTFYRVTVSFYLLFHSAVAQFADVALYKGNMYKKYTPHSTLSTLHTGNTSNTLLQESVLRDCISMCFDICTINIRVSIRVHGLHLVSWLNHPGMWKFVPNILYTSIEEPQ